MNFNNPELKYWLAFSKCNRVGNVFIEKIYERFKSLNEAWHASSSDLLFYSDLTHKQIEEFAQERKKINPEQLIDELFEKDISVITIADDNYPPLLKEIPKRPAIFYFRGNLKECNLSKTLAVVGSRKLSKYASDVLTQLISDFPSKDMTIISGMALGADACAHQAALKNGIKTIAVLGSGFDHIYPRENINIYKKILDDNGAVISEYYFDMSPQPWMFPHRNRIVSGLSQGSLIVEAAEKSGALITARTALEQNREVMCIPGAITNPNTKGIYKLIKEGTSIVTEPQDIFNYLNWEIEDKTASEKNKTTDFLDNEEKVYKTLSLDPSTLDEIISKTNLSAEEILITLTTLELKGFIQKTGTQQYARTLKK